MTRPRGELTTYRARGRYATDWANQTRFTTVTEFVITQNNIHYHSSISQEFISLVAIIFKI